MDRKQFDKLVKFARGIGIDVHALTVAIYIGVDNCHRDDMVTQYGTLATEKLLEWRKTESFA